MGGQKQELEGNRNGFRGSAKPALRPKLTVLSHVQAKQHRRHIQKMQTRSCRNVETFGREKIRVRAKPQRIRERRERGKAVEARRPKLIVLGNCSTAGWRSRIPAETYCSRLLREQISPTTHPAGMCRTLAQNRDISEGKYKNWRKTGTD